MDEPFPTRHMSPPFARLSPNCEQEYNRERDTQSQLRSAHMTLSNFKECLPRLRLSIVNVFQRHLLPHLISNIVLHTHQALRKKIEIIRKFSELRLNCQASDFNNLKDT